MVVWWCDGVLEAQVQVVLLPACLPALQWQARPQVIHEFAQ